jgi:hypothetical protein
VHAAGSVPAVTATHPPRLDDLTRALRDLAAAHPEVCDITTAGHSRGGEPLDVLSITGGD